ncbi:MAG: hypothetical protein BM556_03535 [Bacteriovorax sp. MedPE-SWde]|nr:MAG: hypothetical protein BM556_03535 [Bacteriovorax sp. MedPE-SWde]
MIKTIFMSSLLVSISALATESYNNFQHVSHLVEKEFYPIARQLELTPHFKGFVVKDGVVYAKINGAELDFKIYPRKIDLKKPSQYSRKMKYKVPFPTPGSCQSLAIKNIADGSLASVDYEFANIKNDRLLWFCGDNPQISFIKSYKTSFFKEEAIIDHRLSVNKDNHLSCNFRVSGMMNHVINGLGKNCPQMTE